MPEHAAVIAVLLLDRPMCLDCISTKSGLSVHEIERYLTIIATSLELNRLVERCRACGESLPVISLSRHPA